jgi:hypothetical protein
VSHPQTSPGPVPASVSARAFNSGDAQAAAAPAPAAAACTPELVGFVLLDPLWEGGEAVGYVTSMQRINRSAHSGEPVC